MRSRRNVRRRATTNVVAELTDIEIGARSDGSFSNPISKKQIPYMNTLKKI